MAKRVHEIAKERGLPTKDVIEKLKAAGVNVKAASSSVDEATAARVLGNGEVPTATKAPVTEQAPPPAPQAQQAAPASPAAPAGDGRAPGDGSPAQPSDAQRPSNGETGAHKRPTRDSLQG